MLDTVRRMAREFDILHFHIDQLHFPLFRDIAAVAVIAVFAGALVFLAGLALRARRTLSVRRRRGDDVLEARKVDGPWVAYGWERPGR